MEKKNQEKSQSIIWIRQIICHMMTSNHIDALMYGSNSIKESGRDRTDQVVNQVLVYKYTVYIYLPWTDWPIE